MAQDPLDPSNEVEIAADGTVSGQVTVNNGDVVKFQVTGYPDGANVCIVNITSANISWDYDPIAGQNTIKVGN